MLQRTATFASKLALLIALGTPLVSLPQVGLAASIEQSAVPVFSLPESIEALTTVRIDGDRSMAAINQLLKEQYQQQFPETQVEIQAQGTAAALQKLINDEIDLAAIGRPLTAAEKAKGLVEIPLSQERIAVIVGQENPFKGNLTVEQFSQIVRGEVTDWSEVGGEPGAIRFVDRPASSDTRLTLSRYGLFQGSDLTTGATAVRAETDDTAAVIRELGRDGIGYAIANQLTNQKKARIVKLVVMHEALPDDPLYPYAQPRGYAYKKSPDLAARSFLGLATAATGQAAIDAAKASEATALVSALKPAPIIAITQNPESDTSPYAQTRRTIPFWLWLVLPLILLGLLLQAILKGLGRRSPDAPTAVANAGDRPITPITPMKPASILPVTPESVSQPPDTTDAEIILAEPVADSPAVSEIPSTVSSPAIVGGVSGAVQPASLERQSNYWLDFQQVYDRGVNLTANGEYTAAIGCFNRAIELNPNFAEAWIAKGDVLIRQGQREQARSVLEQASRLKPDDETITRTLVGLIETPTEPGVPGAIPPGGVEPTVESASVPEAAPAEPVEPIVPESIPLPPVPEPSPEVIAAPSLGTVNPTASVIPVGDARTGYTVEAFQQTFRDNLLRFQGKSLGEATPQDYYTVLAYMVRDRLMQFPTPETLLARPDSGWIGELSAEYLPGPHLLHNLINLGITETIRQGMEELGQDIATISDQEDEPRLGIGGLGRLMVCYLESLSTQGIPAIGYGIRYEYGIFDQQIQDGWQVEVPDTWLQFGNPWEVQRPEGMQEVKFGGRSEAYTDKQGRYRVKWVPQEVIKGFPYDTPILGYRANTVNLLRLWRAETADSLCKNLYPVDIDLSGRALRLKQQFFLISCSLQDAIQLHLHSGQSVASQFPEGVITQLPQRFQLQLNDTDTALAVAELMRLLVDEQGLEWEQAWEMTCNTLSYTNHSLMPETLDDLWSLELLGAVLPRPLEIVLEINARFLDGVRQQFPNDPALVRRLSLINEVGDRYLRLTHLACVGSHAINGVSQLHTQLLEQKILPDFFALSPEKFSNKTNGISPRRFLLLTNPPLAELISRRIGSDWITNLEALQQLASAADDSGFRQEWQAVKLAVKHTLAAMIRQRLNIEVDPNSLFDGQAMVMHEYKRQHLNVLHILTLYNRIKANPSIDIQPRTFIFSGKAAPDYFTARLIIKLIHAIATVINTDADVAGRLKVVFLPDLTIKLGQQIYPAIDLSEHLSTAGMEASDTGNMIAALNGALIIGTPDGSNLEIRDAIGWDNFFQFGADIQAVEMLRSEGYKPYNLYTSNPELKGAIDLLTSGALSNGDTALFRPLVNLLLSNDYYLLLADYPSYIACQEWVSQTYHNRDQWTRMSILSTARMGRFSSDRAVREYSEGIWRVQPMQEAQQYVQA